ncbi:MAG: hypothetical protein HOO88_08230 [Kiritimatiellaceae bacterium]|nr:hypothetical protein [Kiritimatiellaceae bacterium]
MRKDIVNSIPEKEKAPLKSTPAWLKRSLLVLLFASAAGGFFFCARLVRTSTTGIPAVLSKKPIQKSKFSGLQSFFEKAVPAKPEETILCQGVILSANRGSRAVINGQVVKIGSVVNGARVLEITASNVLVRCNGETRRLAPGERFTPKKP